MDVDEELFAFFGLFLEFNSGSLKDVIDFFYLFFGFM
jgi:hypothetical protein